MKFDLIECPECRVRENACALIEKEDALFCAGFFYPVNAGIPDLRLSSDRGATSYDAILPEWTPPETCDPEAVMAAYGVTPDMVRGKTVCVAGVGGGSEIVALSALAPGEIHALEFSSFIGQLAPRFPTVHFYQGDICNMPFRRGVFDLIVSGGIIQHTRSPELAARSMVRSLRDGGHLAVANMYKPGLHNRRVTIHRNRHEFHRLDTKKAKKKLKINSSIYYALIKTGLWRLHRQWPFPGILEYCNIPGMSRRAYYENALDYYLCRFRHTISEAEFEGYCAQIGAEWAKTRKGYLVTHVV